MINAAIIGIGRSGQNLVNSVQGQSDVIRFVAGATRTPEKAKEYAAKQGIALYGSYAKVLADPRIDAVILATPHTRHAGQIVAAGVRRADTHCGAALRVGPGTAATFASLLTCFGCCLLCGHLFWQRESRRYAEAALGTRSRAEAAVQHCDPFAHSGDSVPGSFRLPAAPVVDDFDRYFVVAMVDGDAAVVGAGVPHYVGDRLLDDAERR